MFMIAFELFLTNINENIHLKLLEFSVSIESANFHTSSLTNAIK